MPAIAKLNLLGFLFFPSLKDPLIGQNQFQTVSVPLAGAKQILPPPKSLHVSLMVCLEGALPGGSGEAGLLPSQTPLFASLSAHYYPC